MPVRTAIGLTISVEPVPVLEIRQLPPYVHQKDFKGWIKKQLGKLYAEILADGFKTEESYR